LKILCFYSSKDDKFKKHNEEQLIEYTDCDKKKNKDKFDEYVFRKANLPAYYFYSGDKLKYNTMGLYLTDNDVKEVIKRYE